MEQETRHPEMVTHIDSWARTDLILPLGRHNLGVDTGNVDAGEHAGFVVGFYNITAVDLSGTDTAVVRALRTGETAFRPAIWPATLVEKGIFLFKTEPKVVFGMCLHQFGTFVTVVELIGGAIRVPTLAQNEDVLTLPEWIGVDSDGANVDIGVVTGGLTGRRAIEIPFGKLFDRLDGFVEGLEEMGNKKGRLEKKLSTV
jgi:hypothetical protein